MEEIEYKLGQLFYKSEFIRILVSCIFAAPFAYKIFLIKGSSTAVLSFALIQLSSDFFLSRFSKKYLLKRRSEWLITLYDETGLSEEKLSEIIGTVVSATTKMLIKENRLPEKKYTMEIFKEEFKDRYALKLSLNHFNIIKNSLTQYEDGAYSLIKEIFMKFISKRKEILEENS